MPCILIADDHDLVRETVAAYLGQVDEFTVLTAASLDAGIKVISGEIPVDLAVLDYNMPGMDGLDGLDRMRRSHPQIKVMLLSGSATREVATDAMARGADGFIPKSMPASSMVNAIRFVLAGEKYFPFDFAAQANGGNSAAEDAGLSERERQTLEQLCLGLTNKQIARNLGLQEVTVKLHVKNLMAKLGVSNRTQAALLAKERHLV
ncbi:chemotaxis protein CheY [Actibacterium mucosum KCTC 23349]|uniref:Chemotaxis protein CheY n=1 Tax=Actibacterium mucosum KCTC 23349 TaxID=1454373 RepID=A0A037ZHS9_9RHOB|nr:response regulator transcription factor [Actibacterium mucosum]KAJ55102.1 chemotaxis protein CheY [Actibacterium mucosum KCTC 23349]